MYIVDSLATRLTILVVSIVTLAHLVMANLLFLNGFDRFLIEQEHAQRELAERVLGNLSRLESLDDIAIRSAVDHSGVLDVWWQDKISSGLLGGSDRVLEQDLRASSNFSESVELRVNPVDLDVHQAVQDASTVILPLSNDTWRQLKQLHLAAELAPGRWLNITIAAMPQAHPPIVILLLFFAVTWLALTVASVIAANLLARPFKALSKASEAMAKGEFSEPIAVFGPSDVRQALQAFNRMSERLQNMLNTQRELLLAIGHDLRTPITSLRIRSEFIGDEDERRRINRSLDQLQCLTESALNAGRNAIRTDPKVAVDAGALVDMVCEDLIALGMKVSFVTPEQTVVVQAWPDELSRAIRNVVENAVRYGEQADVRFTVDDDYCSIIVEDCGPGIPEDRLNDVFNPLTRIEASRNRDTGGHGLGLSIARNIVSVHGGKISLENREPVGLTARILLPVMKNLNVSLNDC